MNLDLDKARAARDAARGEPNTLTFGGKTFDLPPELPLEAAEVIERGNVRAGMTALLNGQAEAFFALEPTMDDIHVLLRGTKLPDGTHVQGIIELYVPGTDRGES